MSDVREHPNYAKPAFTVEEAERHAAIHQSVNAFRMLKLVHETEERLGAKEIHRHPTVFGMSGPPIYGDDGTHDHEMPVGPDAMPSGKTGIDAADLSDLGQRLANAEANYAKASEEREENRRRLTALGEQWV